MRYIRDYKIWKKITEPNRRIFFWQFVSCIIPAILELLITAFSANLIASLSVFDYYMAKHHLTFIIVLTVICFLFWNINYILYPKQLKHIYINIHDKIFNKIINTDDNSLKDHSKEKMINILSSNTLNIAEFTNDFTNKISYLLTSVIMLIFIVYYNYLVGFLIFIVGLLSYIIYSIVNLQFTKQNIRLQESRDILLENFGDIVDGKNISSDLNLVSKLKDKYILSVKNITNNYKKEHILKLFAEKHIFFFWKLLIYLITFYLIYSIQTYNLSLTIYLILTPYLSSTILNFFNFLSVFSKLNVAKISALRIKTILDMNEKDIIEYGNNSTNTINGSICFTNVSYSQSDQNSKLYGSLEKFSLYIKSNNIILFEGVKGCGKRALFYMLRREIRPTTGTITLDTINIYDFDQESYTNNISYVTRAPYFFNDSIISNLKYINKNLTTIKETLKDLNIYKDIQSLNEGLDTNIFKESKKISQYLLFMIGLARSILTNSEIILIYEFPVGLSELEHKNISRVLTKLKKSKTIIIFSANNMFPDSTDIHYNINNGQIKIVN